MFNNQYSMLNIGQNVQDLLLTFAQDNSAAKVRRNKKI